MAIRCAPSLVCVVVASGLLLSGEARAQDFDGDSRLDASDNCPTVVNGGQEDRGGLASYLPNGSGDACECGDVNGDGAAHLNDATLIRRRLAGLGPGLARPELCSVAGESDARDANADGLRDDCTLVDFVVLRRALLGKAPGRGSACGNVVPADRVAPAVRLIAPSVVTAGGSFSVRAEASDEVGVARVALLVDGALAREASAGDLVFEATAPALPGVVLALRVEAFDAAGNRGDANASVVVDAAPDLTAPSVSLVAPPTAAPGASVALAARAEDERGVALVRFLRAGEVFAADATAPYEATLAVAPDATLDTVLALEAEAIDAEGNLARASALLRVVAGPDGSPPTDVVVSAPARATPGQSVRASASAQDDVGVLEIEFFVDGARVATDAFPPYEASYVVAPGAAPGTTLRWSARAVDFSRNAATSPEVQTLVAAPGRALVVGEVYDDTRSQPLAGARVRVGGTALETTSDARGRFALELAEGAARLLVSRDGFTDADRRIDVPSTGVVSPLDCRLTPRGPETGVSPNAGSTVSSTNGGVALAFPAGALAAPTEVRLTPLSEQGLPAPLPLGWSPLAAVEITPIEAALALGGVVTFREVVPPPGTIAARFDLETGAWRRVASNASEVTVTALGAVALAVPDAEGGPAIPAVGEALGSVAARIVPASASAQILPSPRVLFLSPDARSDVVAAIDTAQALPSGTAIPVRLSERYDRTDGSVLTGEPSTQDVLLYRRPEGLRAAFRATPSELFDAALLREGVITLDALALDLIARASVDASGAIVSAPNAAIEVPAGAFATPTAVAIASLAALDPALAADPRLRFVAGARVDLGAVPPVGPIGLRVRPAVLPASGSSVLVAQAIRARDATRFEWVGTAEVEGEDLVVRAGALGLPLPGVRSGGDYFFLEITAPVAFVAGSVTPESGAPLARTLVETPSLPLVSIADAADARYALALVLGATSVAGTDLTSGASAAAAISPATAGAVTALDLALAASRPAVASVAPVDLARQVDVDAAVEVQFTRAIDARTLTADTLRLLDGVTPVAGAVFVAADGLSATFRPAAPLRGLAPYTVALGAEVSDVFGNRLLGNLPNGSFRSTFETFDTAPPPRPAPGLVTLSIPRDGETDVQGSIGSAPEGTLAFAFNVTSGAQTVAVAQADGSFFASLAAASTDVVVLALQSLAGEVTVLDPIPFTDPDGSVVIGARGGAFESAAGVRLSALPNALARTDEMRLTDLAGADLPSDLPTGVTLLRGFRLEVPPALVQSVSELEIAELSGRIVGAETFATPLRVQATRATSPGTTTTTRFEFSARATDGSRAVRALSVQATGSATPCSGTANAAQDTEAPRMRLTAPSCLGPSQTFDLAAEAIQPRFDLSTPALAGDSPGTQYLLLRRVSTTGTATVYELVETATVQTVLGAPRAVSDSRTPFGLRASGDYLLARADAPLAFVEGVASGDAALLTTDRSALGASTSTANGAFLLPVPAGQTFALRTLSPVDGAERASEPRAAIGAGQTVAGGFVGPSAPTPLSVETSPGEGGIVAANAALSFRFSEALDPATVVATSLFVQDGDGRAIEGTRVLASGDTSVAFQPLRPWRAGESYSYRVTRELLARSGARLLADATGAFAGFSPALLAIIAGEDVRDAAVLGNTAYVLDGNRLRALDLTLPATPVEGTARALSPTPNRVTVAADGASLLVSAGTSADFGTLTAFGLSSPLAPAARGSARLSTPAGASAAAESSPLPGSPGPLASLAAAVVIGTRGVGLQRVDLAALIAGTLSAPPLAFETPANLADAASDGTRLASVGPDGLQIHDPATLAVVGSAPVDGTAQDVDLATVGSRTLALVAAGLPGGVQVFDVTDPATPTRVAKILTGCAAQRIAIDAPFQRAWLACAGTRILALDLAGVDGLDPIDRDADGRDDRLGGAISVPVPLVNFTLDAPRNVALISAGTQGLAVVQLGPAEAVIADVVRDPIGGGLADAESVLGTGRTFIGDREIRAVVDARIPPGAAALRGILDGDASLSFVGGSRERMLGAGRIELAIRPVAPTGSSSALWTLRILDGVTHLTAFAGSLDPVPIDSVVALDARDLVASSTDPVPLSVAGIADDGRVYNLTPLARFEVSEPAIASISPEGALLPAGGGTTGVTYAVAGRVGTLEVRSTLPPGVARLELSSGELRLQLPGESVQLQVTAVLTDGSRRPASPSEGLAFESSDSAVASVTAEGTVTAVAEGVAEIDARLGTATIFVPIHVELFESPNLSGIEFDEDAYAAFTDDESLSPRIVLLGTGTLEGLPVNFRIEGFGAAREGVALSRHGIADFASAAIDLPGSGLVTASVVDPADGETFTANVPLTVVERNRDSEPNDSRAAATLASAGATLVGQVGDGDVEDVYRFELDYVGQLGLEISSTDDEVRVVVSDASGATLAEATGGATAAVVGATVTTVPVFVSVAPVGGSAGYRIRTGVSSAIPTIDRVEPASGQPGDIVTIRGSGFSPRPGANTVFFNGVGTDVVNAATDALAVIVPAFATDGPLQVWVRSQPSNLVPFTTGLLGDWWDAARLRRPDPATLVRDPRSGMVVARESVEVAFLPGVVSEQVEALAASLGAEIDAIWPQSNVYVLRFPGLADLDAMHARVDELASRPDVRYAMPDRLLEKASFRIAGRDSIPNRGVPDREIGAAWAQIRAPEAWQAVADSGRFSSGASFFPVIVALFDNAPVLDSAALVHGNRRQLEGIFTTFDRARHTGAPFLTDHGTHALAVIGARNVKDNLRRMTGVLGGVLPADADPFYTIEVYDDTNPAGGSDRWEARAGLLGCIVRCPNPNGCGGSDFLGWDKCIARQRPMHVASLEYQGFSPAKVPTGINFIRARNLEKAFWKPILDSRPDVLFVTSAGNSGGAGVEAKDDFPGGLSLDPAIGPHLINVGAVGVGSEETDDVGADVRARFSTFGSGIDITAPGERVLSVHTYVTGSPDVCRRNTNLTANTPYDFFCGTSASNPLVAGAAALLKALDERLTAPELKAILQESATPIPASDWGTVPVANRRRLDIHAAVQRVLAGRAATITAGGFIQSVAVDPTGTTPFNPGRKRLLWVADALRDEMRRLQIPVGFEAALSGTVPVTPSIPLQGCEEPAGAIASATGDKLYIACRGSQRLLVWNANVGAPARFDFTGATIEPFIVLPRALPAGGPIQMALSAAGVLAVPLSGGKVSFVDTRSDTLLETRSFNFAAARGGLRALAFSFIAFELQPLFAVTSGGTRPVLARADSSGDPSRWLHNSSQPTDTEELRTRGVTPTGLTFQDSTNEPLLYVLYEGSSADKAIGDVAASIHSAGDLSLVQANGVPVLLRSNVEGRRGPIFRHGEFVSSRAADSVLRTAASGLRGLAIHPGALLGYALFRGTGNVGILSPEPGNGAMRTLEAVTAVDGGFFGARSALTAVLQASSAAQAGGAGTAVSAGVEASVDLTDARVYVQARFPAVLALDQQGSLLATHFGGVNPALRVYSSKALTDAVPAMVAQGRSPASTSLDELRSVSTNLPVELQSVRAMLFQPQLSVAAPAPGSITRGVVSVRVLVRDEAITGLSCRVFNFKGTQVGAGAYLFSPEESKLGVAVGSTPVCTFANLADADYVLRVEGIKGSARIVTTVPFRHDGILGP